MGIRLKKFYESWEDNSDIGFVMMKGSERAFCAGGDVVSLYNLVNQAFYRAAKAAFALELLPEAASYCQRGLEQFPSNEELKKLSAQIDLKKKEDENHKAEAAKALAEAKELASAIESRGLKLGKAMYQELIGVRKPILDKSKILHWPVLLLYADVMSSDFIEDFYESVMFSAHLDMMYSETSGALPWDTELTYTRESIELYYQAHSGILLSKNKILQYLLEGTVGSLAEGICDEEKDGGQQSPPISLSQV